MRCGLVFLPGLLFFRGGVMYVFGRIVGLLFCLAGFMYSGGLPAWRRVCLGTCSIVGSMLCGQVLG